MIQIFLWLNFSNQFDFNLHCLFFIVIIPEKKIKRKTTLVSKTVCKENELSHKTNIPQETLTIASGYHGSESEKFVVLFEALAIFFQNIFFTVL